MIHCLRLAFELAYTPVLEGLTLLELGALSDHDYAELVGFDRRGVLHLRDGEVLDDRDDGWAGDLDPGIGGGDGAGCGGQFD